MGQLDNIVNQIMGRDQKVISYTSPSDPVLRRIVINSLEMITGRNSLEVAYQRLKTLNKQGYNVWTEALAVLNIHLSYSEDRLNAIPSTGSLVVIANHPFGVVDGLALGKILSLVRQDFFLIVNKALCKEEMLGSRLLPIDFAGTRDAMKTNINTRKRAIEIVKNGGAVGIFPSGGVATAKNPFRTAQDLEWKQFLVKLVRPTATNVLPIFFKGKNSPWFQWASFINPNLRLGLLLNEVNNKRGSTIEVQIGDLLPAETLSTLDRSTMLDFLKDKTMSLAD